MFFNLQKEEIECVLLKVHKREKFFVSDFEFFTILKSIPLSLSIS
jgi:hypothetical protein